jgi:thiamine biosynthesis lipoprotein
MVDIIHSILDKKYEQFIINFWGDIRIKWSQKLFLEDPLNESKSIGEIELSHLALAGSNPRKRMTKKWHHLINPFPERPIDQKLTVFTSHKLACFADAFATALYVAPLEKSIKILEKVEGLEWMIIAENGEIYKSQAFDVELYI